MSQYRKKGVFKQLFYQQVFDVKFDFNLLRSIGRDREFCKIPDGLSETSPQPTGADGAHGGTLVVSGSSSAFVLRSWQ